MNKTRLKADILLLITAIVWGSAFSAQRVAAENIGPFLFNGSRFLLGGLILLPFALKRRKKIGSAGLIWVIPAGILIYIAGFFQQAGLEYTTAGNAGFITSLYVIFVPIILLIVFKQRQGPLTWTGALVAVTGLFLLSIGDNFTLQKGDVLEFIGSFFWAMQVVLVSKSIKQIDIFQFATGQAIIAGSLNLITGLIFETNSMAGFSIAWWTVVYTGVFSVSLAYTLQVAGQRHAPPTDSAIILSLEAFFAAFFGYILLNEGFSERQLLGCLLMIIGILIVQIKRKSSKK